MAKKGTLLLFSILCVVGTVWGQPGNEFLSPGTSFYLPNEFSPGGPPVIQGPITQAPMIQGPIIQGPMAQDPMIQGGMNQGGIIQGFPLQGGMGLPVDSSFFPSQNYGTFDLYGTPLQPTTAEMNLLRRRVHGIIKAQEVPDNETLLKALAKQLELWSPESTLLETIYPDTVMKMTIPFGIDTRFLCRTQNEGANRSGTAGTTRPATEPAYAVGILCWNLPIGTRRIFIESSGPLTARVGYHYQQNRGELLAALAMAQVASTYEIRLSADSSSTIADLVKSEMKEISFYEDLSMISIGLAFYLEDVGETWTDCFGQTVSLVSLADYELNRPVYWNRSESVNRLLGLTLLSDRFHQEMEKGNADRNMRLVTEKIDRYLTTILRRAVSERNDAGLCLTRFLSTEKIESASDILLVNGHWLRWLLIASDRFPVDPEAVKKSIYHLAFTLAQFYNPKIEKMGAYSPKEIEAISVSLHAIRLYFDKYSESDFTL